MFDNSVYVTCQLKKILLETQQKNQTINFE